MKINRYGLPMHGLKKASGETENEIRGYREIFYQRSTGEIWTRWHPSTNSWTQYDDPNIVRVCNTSRHLTMQDLADEVANACILRDYYDKINQ